MLNLLGRWTYLDYNELYVRWSRGSVLAFGTQVRGFKSGRSRRLFKGEKILSTPSFGGEVKPSIPCRRFAACKISLELRGSRILGHICPNISRPRRVPPSAARGLSRRWTWPAGPTTNTARLSPRYEGKTRGCH